MNFIKPQFAFPDPNTPWGTRVPAHALLGLSGGITDSTVHKNEHIEINYVLVPSVPQSSSLTAATDRLPGRYRDVGS